MRKSAGTFRDTAPLETPLEKLVLAFEEMIKTGIVMPLSAAGKDTFQFFSKVPEGLGMYAYSDYIEILEHLLKRWKIDKIEGLSEEAQKARDYLCKLPDRYRKFLGEKRLRNFLKLLTHFFGFIKMIKLLCKIKIGAYRLVVWCQETFPVISA